MVDSLPPMKNLETPRVLKVLEALKQASRDLRAHPAPDTDDSSSSAIKALLELQNESDTILSSDPHLSPLSLLLARLKSLVDASRARHHGLGSFVTRRVSAHSIARLAESIEAQLQAWIDRESVEGLARALKEGEEDDDELKSRKREDESVALLTQFEDRVSEGFDRELQDVILRSKIFSSLESILRNQNRSVRIREHCASSIGALIRFNKDVFVGQVLLGPTIKALIGISTTCSMKVLSGLIRSIKSPLVDEIESNGAVSKIVLALSSDDPQLRILALDCALEIGYFGRKEAIDAMLEAGLVEELVEMQRTEPGLAPRPPFARGVVSFAVSLEVGEGLRQREKRAFKLQILARVREASGSAAEAATILAEVLWGSSP